VWGESEVWVIEKSRSKTKNLIQKMKEVLGSFNRDTVVKTCMNLRPRIYRLLLMLTAVLIKKMILDMYLCKFAFTSIKSDDFLLCCVI
jgi:hypothetical protein